AGEDHQHLVVKELLPLGVVLRHVRVDDNVLAVVVDQYREMGSMQRAAGAGHQHGKAVGAHERHELGTILQPVVGGGVHQSSRATAMAAMPSPRPMKPSCSVVVALMLIAPGATPRSAAMLPTMRVTWGAMRGASATMVASTFTTLSLRPPSFFATSRRSWRLSISEYCGSVSG